jgi:MYXO-CTERM domain-containing protein
MSVGGLPPGKPERTAPRRAQHPCQDGGIVKNRSLATHEMGHRAWRDLLRLLVESLATGAFVSVVLALAVFIVATQAHAAVGPATDAVAPVGVIDPVLALTLLALAGALRRRHRGPAALDSIELAARAARQVC